MDAGLLADIKFNCDVSDAQYWGYFSVCGLLMRYRDLYRSERELRPWSQINRAEIASWIEQKETKWPELETKEYKCLTMNGTSYHPFDVETINKALADQKLVYGAGYGMYLKPTFFLAELRSARTKRGLTVYTSGREIVRDLFSSPAMLQEKTIFLRLEPLVMLLLYKHSELNTRSVSALEDAFSRYGFSRRQLIDATFEQRMESMAERYAEVLLAHELAEAAEEVPSWKDILALAAGDRQVEHYLRAVKDLVADTSDEGPYRMIAETRDRGALSFSLALMEGYRRMLFPEMRDAYAAFSGTEDWSLVEAARTKGYERFRKMMDQVVTLHRTTANREEFLKAVKKIHGAEKK